MSDAPLVYTIVQHLLKKGETVRVHLQRGFSHEGLLIGLEQLKTTGLIRFTYEAMAIEPLHIVLTSEALEEHSKLEPIDVGWLLTVHEAIR